MLIKNAKVKKDRDINRDIKTDNKMKFEKEINKKEFNSIIIRARVIYFFMLLVFLFGIGFVSAGSLEQPVKFNSQFDLVQTCSDCIFVELTSVTYPNGTLMIMGINMTKVGEDYSYPFGNTSQLGTYKYNTCGDLLSSATGTRNLKCEVISFEVTSTGEKVSLSNIILPIILLLLAGLCLVLGFSFNKDHWLLKTFFNFAATGMGILAINSAGIIASESLSLGKMGTTGLLFMTIIFSLFFIYMFVYYFIETIKTLKEKGNIRWNY